MVRFTQPLERLIEELQKLPGIGRKSAQRISFQLLKTDKKNAMALAQAIVEAREKTFFCSLCNNITANDPCEICSDPQRETNKICVVEEPFNIYSIEKTGLYRGLYHVIAGNLSPLRGVGPEDLKIDGLLRRVEEGGVEEVILATSPTTEGSATAHYLTDMLKRYKILLTRVALGLPVGADLDYVDQMTIAKAIEGRVAVK